MSFKSYSPATWGVGAKITAFTFALVGLLLGGLIWMISQSTASLLAARSQESLQNELNGVRDMVAVFHRTLSTEAATYAGLLASDYPGPFTVDALARTDIGGKAVHVVDGKEPGDRHAQQQPGRFDRYVPACLHGLSFTLNSLTERRHVTWRRRAKGDRGCAMDLDQLIAHYFGTTDPDAADPAALDTARERMGIDFGVERDPSRRFALWTLMDAFGFAPPPAEAFEKHPDLRAAAERYLDAAYRVERDRAPD